MAIIIPESDANKYFFWKAVLFVLVFVICIILSYFLANLLKLESPWKYIDSIILGVVVGLLFVVESEYFNGDLDEHDFKFKEDCIKWKSDEFDNFIGKELLELYQDSCDIFYYSNRLPYMSDYSFMLLPMAKVYEGFLKKILVAIGLTKEVDWKSNPGLSVNRYFNPIKNSKIVEALEDKARDKTVPHVVYSTYQECRNSILHHDSCRDSRIKTLEDAEFYKKRIEYAIEKAYETFIKK